MLSSQLRNPESVCPPAGTWRVIKSEGGIRRRKASYRKWRAIHMRSANGMVLSGLLFFLVWLGISMLMPRNHLFAGTVLLLILAADAACVIAYLISDYMLQKLRHRR